MEVGLVRESRAGKNGIAAGVLQRFRTPLVAGASPPGVFSM